MNENPRMLVAFCLEKYSLANRANMLANMLVQMLIDMVARFAGAFILQQENSDFPKLNDEVVGMELFIVLLKSQGLAHTNFIVISRISI